MAETGQQGEEMGRIIIILCVMATIASGQVELPQRFNRDAVQAPKFDTAEAVYWGSVSWLVAGHYADHRSSLGGYELNPLLRGADGRYDSNRGALIKAAAIGANVVVQRLWIGRKPGVRKWATVVNFAAGAGGLAMARRNRGHK